MSKQENRNEDKFGIINDQNHQFKSLDEAGNYVKDLKGKLDRKASMEEFPITTAMPEDRKKMLLYGISLMTKKNLPFKNTNRIVRAQSVLSLMVNGYTHAGIAFWLRKNVSLNATVEQVKSIEKEGMDMVIECIDKVRSSCTPIIGG